MNILVTGGAGFIGSHLTESLVKDGHSVTVLDNFDPFYDPEIKHRNISSIFEKITLLEMDICDRELILSLAETHDFDVIVHLAAKAGVRPSIENPTDYIQTNVQGTLNLLDLAIKMNVNQFVLASSSSVYGKNKKVPFSEEDPLHNVISPYAASKVAAENLAHTYSSVHKLPVVALRFFTVYGPRQRPDLAIHKFCRKILHNEPIQKYGKGNTSRDYTYIDDIVHGIRQALNYDEQLFSIFNLGEHKTIRLSELIAAIENALDKKATIEQLPEQPGDVPHTFAEINKAKTFLGYTPETDIHTGLKAFVKWLKEE